MPTIPFKSSKLFSFFVRLKIETFIGFLVEDPDRGVFRGGGTKGAPVRLKKRRKEKLRKEKEAYGLLEADLY